MLDSNNIKYIRRYRGLYNNGKHYEIDFLINNIGIEINDLNGHNIKVKNNNYHINKTLLAKEKGIRLIHIWEWEIKDNKIWNKISKWIIDLLNNNKIIIDARKCIIKEISKDIEKEFLNKYHLQGYIKSDISYGLYYNEELVQVISLINNNDNNWQILRFCNKYGYVIISGAQNLLCKFIKEYSPKSIIAYCNLDKFTNNIYIQLQFKLLKRNDPEIITYNNMSNNYKKVYNCGSEIYVYKIE